MSSIFRVSHILSTHLPALKPVNKQQNIHVTNEGNMDHILRDNYVITSLSLMFKTYTVC